MVGGDRGEGECGVRVVIVDGGAIKFITFDDLLLLFLKRGEEMCFMERKRNYSKTLRLF